MTKEQAAACLGCFMAGVGAGKVASIETDLAPVVRLERACLYTHSQTDAGQGWAVETNAQAFATPDSSQPILSGPAVFVLDGGSPAGAMASIATAVRSGVLSARADAGLATPDNPGKLCLFRSESEDAGWGAEWCDEMGPCVSGAQGLTQEQLAELESQWVAGMGL